MRVRLACRLRDSGRKRLDVHACIYLHFQQSDIRSCTISVWDNFANLCITYTLQCFISNSSSCHDVLTCAFYIILANSGRFSVNKNTQTVCHGTPLSLNTVPFDRHEFIVNSINPNFSLLRLCKLKLCKPDYMITAILKFHWDCIITAILKFHWAHSSRLTSTLKDALTSWRVREG